MLVGFTDRRYRKDDMLLAGYLTHSRASLAFNIAHLATVYRCPWPAESFDSFEFLLVGLLAWSVTSAMYVCLLLYCPNVTHRRAYDDRVDTRYMQLFRMRAVTLIAALFVTVFDLLSVFMVTMPQVFSAWQARHGWVDGREPESLLLLVLILVSCCG